MTKLSTLRWSLLAITTRWISRPYFEGVHIEAIGSCWVMRCCNRLYHNSCTKRVGSLCDTPRHSGRYVGYNVKLMIEYFFSPKKKKKNRQSIAEQLFFLFHKYPTRSSDNKKARTSILIVRHISYHYNAMMQTWVGGSLGLHSIHLYDIIRTGI